MERDREQGTLNTISRPTHWIAAGCLAAAGLLVGQGPAAAQPQHEQRRPQGHDAHSRHMEHRFDDPERYARSFDDPARDAWQMPERVIAALSIAAGEAVADIGAGTGYFTVRIAEQTAARVVFAVDIEPAMVDYVRERATEAGLAQIAGVLAAPDSPNLPEPVDVVLIVNTFHHIADRIAYFRRALRDSLAPGARLAIVDHRKGAPGGGPPDEFRLTPDEIDTELALAGYRRQSRHDFLPRQNFLVYGVSEPAGNR